MKKMTNERKENNNKEKKEDYLGLVFS